MHWNSGFKVRGKHLNKKNKFGPHLFFFLIFFLMHVFFFSSFLNGISIVVVQGVAFFLFFFFKYFFCKVWIKDVSHVSFLNRLNCVCWCVNHEFYDGVMFATLFLLKLNSFPVRLIPSQTKSSVEFMRRSLWWVDQKLNVLDNTSHSEGWRAYWWG